MKWQQISNSKHLAVPAVYSQILVLQHLALSASITQYEHVTNGCTMWVVADVNTSLKLFLQVSLETILWFCINSFCPKLCGCKTSYVPTNVSQVTVCLTFGHIILQKPDKYLFLQGVYIWPLWKQYTCDFVYASEFTQSVNFLRQSYKRKIKRLLSWLLHYYKWGLHHYKRGLHYYMCELSSGQHTFASRWGLSIGQGFWAHSIFRSFKLMGCTNVDF